MPSPNPELLGTALLAALGLLSAYFLLLRIKEYHTEKPDPKLTYATHPEVDALRATFHQCQRECRQQLDTSHQRQQTDLATIHTLIRKNAEHIAALLAQHELTNQRLSELAQRTDRLHDRD